MGNYILFTFLFIGVLISYVFVSASNSILDTKLSEKRAYAEKIGKEIYDWYRSNAVTIDSNPNIVNTPFSLDYNGVVLSSKRVPCFGTNLQAHVFAVVLPEYDFNTYMDINTGAVNKDPDDIVVIISGCEIQQNLYNASVEKVKTIANWLESYFYARNKMDIYGQKNYFASTNCNGWGDLPCSSGTSAKVLKPFIGGTDTDYETAYGNDILFDNSSPFVSNTQPPYSCRVGFLLPWGGYHWVVATGKL